MSRYNKYDNVKSVVGSISFDSKAEAAWYQELTQQSHPLKVIRCTSKLRDNNYGECPICRTGHTREPNYCHYCGQKLNWSI